MGKGNDSNIRTCLQFITAAAVAHSPQRIK